MSLKRRHWIVAAVAVVAAVHCRAEGVPAQLLADGRAGDRQDAAEIRLHQHAQRPAAEAVG